MKKQMIRRLGILSLLLSLLVAPVRAQNIEHRIIADIPFDFVVGNKTFPAGVYTIKHLTSALLLIRSEDGRHSTTLGTTARQSGEKNAEPRVVFHRYGERYFIASVWTSRENYGRQFRTTRDEERLAKSGAARQPVTVAGSK